MSLYKRGDTWWIYICHKGQRIRCSAETDNRQKAQEYHDHLKNKLWRQTKLGERPASEHSFGDAAKLWLKESPRGDEDKYRLKWLLTQLETDPIGELTAERLHAVLDLKPEASAATVNRYIALISAVLNLASDKWGLPRAPKLRRRPATKGRTRWLTADEWATLLKHLPPHLRQMARFAVATGLRENNVINLEWTAVDLKRKTLTIHPDQAKNKEPLGLPLNKDAVRVLHEQQGLHPQWVFPYKGAPVTRATNHAWKKALSRAGIKDFRWHDLRHTWASWSIMNGTRIEELLRLGGWKTLSMVQRYAHLSPEHLARAAANARPVKTATPTPQKKTESSVSP